MYRTDYVGFGDAVLISPRLVNNSCDFRFVSIKLFCRKRFTVYNRKRNA